MLYAQTALCRWKVLMDYFGVETPWDGCEHCDNCLEPPAERIQQPSATIP